jgi:hypothetical protein
MLLRPVFQGRVRGESSHTYVLLFCDHCEFKQIKVNVLINYKHYTNMKNGICEVLCSEANIDFVHPG